MKVRIAVIRSHNGYCAHGNDGEDDTKLIAYIKDNWTIDGDIFFVECELPEKPLTLVGEAVL